MSYSTTRGCDTLGLWNLPQRMSIIKPLHAVCQGRSTTVDTSFCRRTTTAKMHYPLPSLVSTELNWFIPPGAFVQYAATFLAGGKWSDSERWLTWFCLCFLMLQTGLSQDSVCWRFSYICNTALVAGNLGYLVHPFESLYCAEQGHFPFCLPSVYLTRHYLVNILFNIYDIIFGSLHMWVMCVCLCPPAHLSTPSLLVDMFCRLSRDWHFILVSEKWCYWFHDRLQFVGHVISDAEQGDTPLSHYIDLADM